MLPRAALAVLTLTAGEVGAQGAPGVPAPDLAFVGLLTSVVGCVPGAALGSLAYRVRYGSAGRGDDFGGLAYAVGGCWFGATVGFATGVHLANARRGRFWPTLGVALATGLAGALVIDGPGADGAWVLVVPAAQVVLTVAIQKRTERARAWTTSYSTP